MLRTHTCGDLTEKDLGKNVSLCGWNNRRRDHGGLIFIDLRDRYGLTQLVFDPKHNKKIHSEAEHFKREDVIMIEGKVRERPKGMENLSLKSGRIEILVEKLEILNKTETPPIEIDDRIEATEEVRLKYRYLDLRRPKMQNNLLVRHKTAQAVREYFNKLNFMEIETPFLVRATPEGARDYVVPSRVNPGKFYALPQSPQLYKQLLMVAGLDRYYQIVRCLRDEDLRIDRQPEFTQIDVEMSFIGENDIYEIMEGLIKNIWKKVLDIDLKIPFKRITYQEAMDKYGTDKPDLRFGLELINVTDIVKDSDFEVFTKVIKSGGSVKVLNVKKKGADFSRNDIDELISFVQIYGAKGLAWMKFTENGPESSIVKFFNEKIQKELIKKNGAEKGDLLLFVADHKHHIVDVALGALRLEIAKRLNLIDEKKFNFLWVVDFPLFEYDEDQQRHVAVHHPFTSPKEEDIPLLEKDTSKIRAKAYDIVLNGVELGGGSIRIHNRELQEKIFSLLGITKEQAEKKFGFLLEAFRYGAPPHGGIAFGFDRLCAVLCGFNDIREVIAFPKNKNAECLMDGSPSEIPEEQLKELRIKNEVVKKEKNAVFENIRRLLDSKNIKYETLEHEAVYTSEQAAKVRKTELKHGAKALVLKTEKGYIMAVVSADKEIDLEKLKKIAKVSSLNLADAKQVKKTTNCNIGSVPPFGNLFSLEVYVDKSLLENEIIAFNAGSHTNSIKMKSKDYITAVNPKIESFSK